MNVATSEEWHAARTRLLAKEKEATAVLAGLASERRSLPMVKISSSGQAIFKDVEGRSYSLFDLFEGRRQLIMYQQMPFNAEGQGCGGCAFFADHVPHGPALSHLHSRDTTFVATAPASAAAVEAFSERMGWKFPFYSVDQQLLDSLKEDEDFLWKPQSGSFRLACFLRKQEDVFLTWETTSRGVEPVLSTYALLDMTKLGRQEDGGASFSLHDQYDS